MNRILPPGSTSADLQTAVENAASGDAIIISGDMPFMGTVTIPEGKKITIQSDMGNHWVMSVPGSYIRHFTIRGNLILQDITLDGGNIGGGAAITGGSLTMDQGAVVQNCNSRVSGGGISASNGSLTMSEGAVVQNCYSGGQGGGAYVNPNGTITINGGVIKENTTAAAGGGMWVQESIFIMTNGEFLGNTAAASGGAIQMLGNNTATISGGIISGNTAGNLGGGIGIPINTSASISDAIISGNTAAYDGGGAYIQGEVTMSNVTVSENTANRRGGGIFSYASGKTEITGKSYIVNNHAPNGGGIFTASATYNNLATGSETVFRCNRASTAHQPPVGAGALYPDIQFASTSITDHPLNNFDINYNVGKPIDVYFNVTYDANGGAGSYTGPDIIPDGTDTVLSPAETGISREGYIFTDWNTEPDGSGIPYAPDDTITITCNVTLYAQWKSDDPMYTVTYNANGGTGAYTSTGIPFAAIYVVLTLAATGISRPDYTFDGWNTQPDGGGTSYSPGDTITITDNITLYAQWIDEPSFYTVTYGANGGSGSFEDSGRQFGDNYLILSPSQTGISRPGFTFTGWNTKPDGSGISFAPGDIITITGDMTLYALWRQNPTPTPKRICPKPVTKCRKNIAGQKIWDDNDDIDGKRPDNVEILLLRDGAVYKRTHVNSADGWTFGFCCLPKQSNSGHVYVYTIDEADVPGYTKTIDGCIVTNTYTP